ncbi:hypothetical protein V1527DRAFT_484727 [Lipomyces starkeyi]
MVCQQRRSDTIALMQMCYKATNANQLPMTKGTQAENGRIRPKVARSMLCDCPWRVCFKKQLNDSWIVTELIDEHKGLQLEGINPLAYLEKRGITAEARATMLELVRHSSSSHIRIAYMLNRTYGLSLLGRQSQVRL